MSSYPKCIVELGCAKFLKWFIAVSVMGWSVEDADLLMLTVRLATPAVYKECMRF
jgi:hypothetical protein